MYVSCTIFIHFVKKKSTFNAGVSDQYLMKNCTQAVLADFLLVNEAKLSDVMLTKL